MKVGVIGCGYVGLVTGVGLALKGHSVTAIDIDKSRVKSINQAIVPFHEQGVTEALRVCLKRANLQVSSSIEDVLDCEVVLICVQTPPRPNGAIDLKILKKAANNLAAVFTKNLGSRVLVVRSTVIPGTTDTIVAPKFAGKVEVAVNPEFLREGSALSDFLNPDRIVIGTHSPKAKKILAKMYAPFKTPIIWTTPSTAELAKYTSNTLLATLISFSNEIAKICEHTLGADVEDVLGIVHRDRRFAPSSDKEMPLGILSYLKAGCGFGGSCLPKDLAALIAYARSLNEKTPFLKAVAKVNKSQPYQVVDMTLTALGGLDKRKVAVLGAAFKGGIDDLRESPGLAIVDELLNRKAQVIIYDPLVSAKQLLGYFDKGASIAPDLISAIKKSDACIIASNAKEFGNLKSIIKQSKNKHIKIIDGRRILKVWGDDERFFAVGRYVSF